MTSKQRKEKSEALLKSLGMTPPEVLPEIDEGVYMVRSRREVAQRILILTYLNCVASDPSLQQEVMMFLIREKLWDEATPVEQALFHKPQLSGSDIDGIFWRKESIWMLLWVIGEVDDVGRPEKEVNLYEIFPFLPGFFEPTIDFISAVGERIEEEIFEQQDFYFRLDWMIGIEKATPAVPLIAGVVHERCLSMSWVTGVNGLWV